MKTLCLLFNAAYYVSGGRMTKMTEEEKLAVTIVIIVIVLALATWGLIILVRYNFKKSMIRQKLAWSAWQDPFWKYDQVIGKASAVYKKAQSAPLTDTSVFRFDTFRQRSELAIIKKKIKSDTDLRFKDVYIVSFGDYKNNAEDEVHIYFEVQNTFTHRSYREIVTFIHSGEGLIITGLMRHPTIYVIAHARSKVEK